MFKDSGLRAPANLVGLLASADGGWFVTFRYSNCGHIALASTPDLNHDEFIKAIWFRLTDSKKPRLVNAQHRLAHISWALKPEYHSSGSYLDYAVRMDYSDQQRPDINYAASPAAAYFEPLA